MSETKSPQSGLTRRGFLKTTGAVVGAAAVGGSVTPTLSALAEDTGTPAEDQGEQIYHNFCRGNCGGVCDLNVKVREGHIVQVRPQEVSREYIGSRQGCVRGQTTPQRLYSTSRVLHPMKRAGERGSGEFECISWDEATETIAQKFKEALDEFGPSALAVYHSFGSSNWLGGANSSANYHPRSGFGLGFERFIRKTGCTLFTPSADMCQMYMSSTGMLAQTFNTANDVVNSDLILIWGCNPTDACRAYWPYVCDARDKGAKIYVIDPQFTTAAASANVYLPIRPGTDGALMLAMCNYVIENDLIDKDYFANGSVAPLLIKEDGTYLKMSDLGVEPTQTTNPLTKQPMVVDPEVVWDPATSSAAPSSSIKDPAIEGSYEVDGIKVRTVFDLVREKTKGFTLEKAAEICDLPLESIMQLAADYATCNAATIMTYQGLGHHVNSRHNFKNLSYLASITGNINKPGASINSNTMGSMAATGTAPVYDRSVLEVAGAKPNEVIGGQHLPEIVESGKWNGKEWPLKALYVVNGNPVASESGRQDFIRAFGKIGFVACADSFFTDTALYSDIVLPICMSFETEDISGRPAASTFMMQKAVEPLGEARSDMDAYRLIAKYMDFPELYDKTDEEYLRATLDSEVNKKNGRAYDDFKREGHWFEIGNVCYVGKEMNGTGRTQFYLPTVIPRSDHGLELEEKEKIPWYESANEASVENPLHAKYPFFGLSDHNNYTGHSMYNNIPWLDDLRQPHARINEDVAREKGIEQGDLVKVFNDHGFCVLKALLTKGIRRDAILMPHGYQASDYVAGHHQDLTVAVPDPVCSNSAFYDYLCDVEKYDGGAA